MKKPAVSEKERAALLFLGKKTEGQCDPFDNHIRGEIGRLSMAIEEGNAQVSKSKSMVEEAEQNLVRNVGAYQATARTYLAYLESSMIRPTPAPTDPPTKPNAESPQEAAGETAPESDPPIPAKSFPAKDDPKEEQDGTSEPEPEDDTPSDPEIG